MNTDDALNFLRSHQPIAAKMEEEETFRKLDAVRVYFAENLDTRAIPLLLNVFGDGDGHGVYAMIESTITHFQAKDVVPHIREGLQSPYRSVRIWCAEIGSSFADLSYRPYLEKMGSAENEDERDAALECLATINSSSKNR